MVSKSFWLLLASLCVFSAAGESAQEMYESAAKKLVAKINEVGDRISKIQGDDLAEIFKIMQIIQSEAKSYADQVDQVLQQIDKELENVPDSTLVRAFSRFNRRVSREVRKFRSNLDKPITSDNYVAFFRTTKEQISNLYYEGRELARKIDNSASGSETISLFENTAEKMLEKAYDMLQEIQNRLEAEVRSADTGNPQPQ